MMIFRSIRIPGSRPVPLPIKLALGLLAVPIVLLSIPVILLIGFSLKKKLREIEKAASTRPADEVIIDIQPKARKQLPPQ